MRVTHIIALGFMQCTGYIALANPYPDPSAVPQDAPFSDAPNFSPANIVEAGANGSPVLRVLVTYDRSAKTYELTDLIKENSGTPALALRARSDDPHGSFRAEIVDPISGKRVYLATQGTGYYFRELSRALSFRFPMITKPMQLRIFAENDTTGAQIKIIDKLVEPSDAHSYTPPSDTEVRSLKTSTHERPITINVYAEGYTSARQSQFWTDANKLLSSFNGSDLPLKERFHINAVWAPSRVALGSAQNQGSSIPERDSFLGLYFPYWTGFGRWYNIVYPTRAERYRRAIAVHPYDYPIALVDSSEYWGVGNFNELTAIPARHSSFTYLLLHEFGHYFGLNEEYDSGGATELAFAPRISEPWSQNITFQNQRENIKWKDKIAASTSIPTPSSQGANQRVGLFAGGYAQTPKPGPVYKPVTQCTMSTGGGFCDVCLAALSYRMRFDAGDFAPAQPTEPDEPKPDQPVPPEDPTPGTEQSCECKLDQSGDYCTLFKGREIVAWTTKSSFRSCDKNFCDTYFAFQRKMNCQ